MVDSWTRTPRRRPTSADEQTPFEIDASRRTKYATFAAPPTTRSSLFQSQDSVWFQAVTCLFFGSASVIGSTSPRALFWRTMGILAILLLLLRLLFMLSSSTPITNTNVPEWSWDHNAYLPPKATTMTTNNLLLVQLSSPRQEWMTDITSRPNRAYASLWGMDYALHTSSSKNLCFHQAMVLNKIWKQSKGTKEEQHGSRRYNKILLLAPDAIITDMEADLRTLLSSDKLVAIAGWNTDNNFSRIRSKVMIWNMDHAQFETAAELWYQHLSSSSVCDDAVLRSVLESMTDTDENVDSLVQELPETTDGFVGSRLIKLGLVGINEGVAKRASNKQAERASQEAALHGLADSVCYRYYPRCEVLY